MANPYLYTKSRFIHPGLTWSFQSSSLESLGNHGMVHEITNHEENTIDTMWLDGRCRLLAARGMLFRLGKWVMVFFPDSVVSSWSSSCCPHDVHVFPLRWLSTTQLASGRNWKLDTARLIASKAISPSTGVMDVVFYAAVYRAFDTAKTRTQEKWWVSFMKRRWTGIPPAQIIHFILGCSMK